MNVIKSHNSNTAIVIGVEANGGFQLVEMHDGELDIRFCSLREYRERGYKTMENYPLERAVQHYLNHQAGVTTSARRELLRLVGKTLADAPAPVTASKKAAEVKPSGVKETIWDKADELWEAAGNPSDVKAILVVRRTVMEVLEVVGINRNTCSNELGRWQKMRLASVNLQNS